MSKPLRLEAVLRAAELHRQGHGTAEIAAELDVSTSTVKRWRAARPDLFAQHEPGSLEHRRSILLEALETGSLSDKLRSIELLERIAQHEKPSGSARIYVDASTPTRCPHCGGSLTEHTEFVVRKDDKPPSTAALPREATNDPGR